MKHTCLAVFLTIMLALFAQAAMGEEATVQMGEKLFNDPTLGGSTNPTSCNACHPGGKGLQKSGMLPNLAETINYCIEKPLQGKKIDEDSVEMQSLILFIKSLDK